MITSNNTLNISATTRGNTVLTNKGAVTILKYKLNAGCLVRGGPLHSTIIGGNTLVARFRPFAPTSGCAFPVHGHVVDKVSLNILIIRTDIGDNDLVATGCTLRRNESIFTLPYSVLSPTFTNAGGLVSSNTVITAGPLSLLCPCTRRCNIGVSRIGSINGVVHRANSGDTGICNGTHSVSFSGLRTNEGEERTHRGTTTRLSKGAGTIFGTLNRRCRDTSRVDHTTNLDVNRTLATLATLRVTKLTTDTNKGECHLT